MLWFLMAETSSSPVELTSKSIALAKCRLVTTADKTRLRGSSMAPVCEMNEARL